MQRRDTADTSINGALLVALVGNFGTAFQLAAIAKRALAGAMSLEQRAEMFVAVETVQEQLEKSAGTLARLLESSQE